jgi:hypothetical protein
MPAHNISAKDNYKKTAQPSSPMNHLDEKKAQQWSGIKCLTARNVTGTQLKISIRAPLGT